MPDYDAIVVGAGHNGLAATLVLAKRGLRVLALEKNDYVGGMAGTREIFADCRNDVGASVLFPLARGLVDELELTRYGVEFIDLPVMSVNVDPPSVVTWTRPRPVNGAVARYSTLSFCGDTASSRIGFPSICVPP